MTNINFGSVDVLSGAAVVTTGTATITCSGNGSNKNISFVFCTDIASGTDASGNQRRMASGSNHLNFDLYQNAALTQEWGNYASSYLGGGNQSAFTTDGSGNLSATITVYAVLNGSQQTAVPGSYSESFSGGATNELQYGSTSGNCPTGSSTSQYSFTVSATLVAGCSVSATTLNFGSTGILASAVNATSTVTATCTSTTPYNIGLNAGTATGATVTTRKMTNASNTISYSLYSNSTRTTNWGNTVGTDTVSGTGSGLGQSYTVFGQVPSQTTPAPATYSDTIVATVTY